MFLQGISSTVRSIGFEVRLYPNGYNKWILAVYKVWALPNRHNLC